MLRDEIFLAHTIMLVFYSIVVGVYKIYTVCLVTLVLNFCAYWYINYMG